MHETTNRCNGHIQVSPAGKGSKRDRKGCKKGKIDAIMKNNMGSTKPKLHIDSLFNKKKSKLLNSVNRYGGGDGGGVSLNSRVGDEILGITAGSVIKSEIIDDPYTFTDCEPSQQNIGLYLTASSNSIVNSATKKDQQQQPLSAQLQLNNINQLHSSSLLANNSIISNSSNNNNNNSDRHLLSNCSSDSSSTNNNSTSNSNATFSNSVLTNNVNKAVTSLSTSYNKYSGSNRNNLNINVYNSNKILNSSSNCGSSNVSNNTNVSRSNVSSVNNHNTNSSSNISSSNNSNSNSGKMGNGISGSHNCIDGSSSKTMNRLQADIARNKVIVKKRKILYQQSQASLSSGSLANNCSSHGLGDNGKSVGTNSVHSVGTVVKCEPSGVNNNANYMGFKYQPRTFAKVSIPAKRLHRQTTWQRERRIRHEALQRIQDAQSETNNIKRDLFPLGLDVSESDDDDLLDMNGVNNSESDEVYQRHWFMGYGGSDSQSLSVSIRGRESRLTQLRSELRRRLRQVWRGIERRRDPPPEFVSAVVTAARTQPGATAMLIGPQRFESGNHSKLNRAKVSMLDVKQCSLCQKKALPCTRHCIRHIMYNVDQLLFEYCTGKLDDKTQCRVPVFDVAHQMPLCPQHARKRDNNVKVTPEISSKKSRKKSKTSTLARSTKRGKKKKKKASSVINTGSSPTVGNSNSGFSDSNSKMNESALRSRLDIVHSTADILADSSMAGISIMQPLVAAESGNAATSAASVPVGNIIHDAVVVNSQHDILSSGVASSTSPTSSSGCIPVSQVEIQVQLEDVVEEVPEEVLAIASLDPAELASQASRLLDQDLSNMLNIPADAFNDLFTEDKNGEYEPTREETEELERALEAVDKDVRSLERMTRSMPALPLSLPLETMTTLLDDPAVTSALPGVYSGVGFPNGFASSVQTDLRHS